MPIRVVQLGTTKKSSEGLRIATVRRESRGFMKNDYATLNSYDIRLPELAPSEVIIKQFRSPASGAGF